MGISLAGARVSATELGIKGTQFTVNGKATFLYGMSYYGALGAPQDFVRGDLDDMQRYGFNWIRVWATWAAFQNDLSAVNPEDGQPRQPFFDRLKLLVADCDRRGMIVDITLARGDGISTTRVNTQEKHRRVVATLITMLKPYRNWYVDLSNERDVRDKRFTSFADLNELRRDVKRIDPARLVTASSGSDIGRTELAEYLNTAEVDFITPHRPRDENSAGQTEEKTGQLLAWMKSLGRVVPVHYQEPFRRGYTDWQPKAEDFVTDALGAKAGGAAGWCFHNGAQRRAPDGKPQRSFDLREKRLFDQLDAEELKALEQLRRIFGSGPQ
jgi:hypothetical protein